MENLAVLQGFGTKNPKLIGYYKPSFLLLVALASVWQCVAWKSASCAASQARNLPAGAAMRGGQKSPWAVCPPPADRVRFSLPALHRLERDWTLPRSSAVAPGTSGCSHWACVTHGLTNLGHRSPSIALRALFRGQKTWLQ